MNQVLLATDFKSTAAHSEWPDNRYQSLYLVC